MEKKYLILDDFKYLKLHLILAIIPNHSFNKPKINNLTI